MMVGSPQSPRRRHILSSINPEEPRKAKRKRPLGEDGNKAPTSPTTPLVADDVKVEGQDSNGQTDATRPRRSRLRLKDHKSRHDSSRHRRRDHDSSRSHRHHRRHQHRSRSPTPPNPYAPESLDPDAAFRESLFDAMADDEGAAYWEGVYGQPVHVYSNERVGPTGELEQMTEEEYAAYVRQKMWEKTHAGLLEERARRQRTKEMKEEEDRQNRKLQEEMEASLRRGEERRKHRKWTDRWAQYKAAWADWDGTPQNLDWPVETGSRKDIDEKNVRHFYFNVLDIGKADCATPLLAQLKDERVRWHPDKIQQRLGGQVDNEVMRDVTAVFQIIDRLWAETRSKS